ncbi:carboxymuconolactone decarboxylase family protein [Microbacterium sp. MYb62]|uniref:carboxymuconolactone decarboxylase family protein n=1 Tax=Microbacterium sp. MYb62 TaxID=1848690 RepID=UPI000CFD405D|nr:carboxymuconolactone decarboxylase family protein [Microbacterium sp. MYb62]PRB14832.1 alkylhydroperoxidase [Microbacterium sp. MYb62]
MDSEITARHFEGIEFVDTRIDHDETGFDAIPRAMAAAYGTTAGASLPLDPQLGELVRLLVAVNSRCAYCTILHAQEARRLGIPSVKVDVISAWRESSQFAETETAAFAYAEALSGLRQGDIQSAHDELRRHFDDAAIETLTMVIINMDVWTRLFLARGHTPRSTA